MIDHVVLDVEIAHTIEETPGGWDATDKLGVAAACLWEYRTKRMRVYGSDDVQALQDRLLAADRISGYNIFNFDFPVVFGINKTDWMDEIDSANLLDPDGKGYRDIFRLKKILANKCNDLLRRIWIALGFNPDMDGPKMGGCKLDDIAATTIGAKKIGNGTDAPKWFKAGKVERVVNYCADDVAIERDLTDFVDKYGYVIHKSRQLFLEEQGIGQWTKPTTTTQSQ